MADNTIGIKTQVETGDSAKKAKEVAAGLDQVTTAAEKTIDSVGKSKAQFAQLAGAFSQVLIANKIKDALFGLATTADQLTFGMAKIKAVTGDLGDSGDVLKNRMLTVSETVGKSFGDVAKVTRDLLAQSLDPGQVGAVLEPLLKFQKLGELSNEQASNLTVALTNMGIEAGSVGSALDVMSKLADATSLNAADFATVMTKAGPAAAVLGVKFSDLAQTAGLLRKAFSSATEEGTAMSVAMNAMTDPKKHQKLKDMFGIDTIDETTGKLKPLMKIFDELNQKVPDNAKATGELTSIFGQRTGSKFMLGGMAALRTGMNFGGEAGLKGKELLDAFATSAETAGGTVDTKFAASMSNLTDQLTRLQAGFTNLIGVLGEGFSSNLGRMVGLFADGADAIRNFLSNNPAMAHFFGLLAESGVIFVGTIGLILGMAGAGLFLKYSVEQVGLAMGKLVLATGAEGVVAGEAAVGVGVFAGGLQAARVGAMGLGIALKGVFRAVLGPFAIIFTLLEVLPWALKQLGIIGSDSSSGVSSVTQDMAKVSDSMKETGEKYGEVTQHLGKIVDDLAGPTIKGGLPFIPTSTMGLNNTILDRAESMHPEIPKVALEEYRKTIADFMAKGGRGEAMTPEETQKFSDVEKRIQYYSAEQLTHGMAGSKKNDDALQKVIEEAARAYSPGVLEGVYGLREVQKNRITTHARSFDGFDDPRFNGLFNDNAGYGGNQSEVANKFSVRPLASGNTAVTHSSGWHMARPESPGRIERATIGSATFSGDIKIIMDGREHRATMNMADKREDAQAMKGGE